MNNRSEGFDSECDVTFDAGEHTPASACVSAFRNRLVAHWLGCDEGGVAAAVRATGTLGGAIEALRQAGHRRLEPLKARSHGAFSRFIAEHHLGDPISAADSLKPWRRRAQMRHKLAAAVHRLKRAEVPAPEVSLGTEIETTL